MVSLLIAGSNGYGNYRHQADICHAYQILKKGGLKDENIVVFMYDDIAFSTDNPRSGVIINRPHGDDVYAGVPKDYTGEDVNVNNFFAALHENKTALTGEAVKLLKVVPMTIFLSTMLTMVVLVCLIFSVECRKLTTLPSEVTDFIHGGSKSNGDNDSVGTRWALLIAGSNGYGNYRHQADICHAYQILKKGGLKDENIVVFMYDDVAFSTDNPRPGVIINRPHGDDVYAGVPKDYTGEDVNVNNFFAALLGNKTALTGGSGKVVDSGPNDHIFVYYADHGGPGVLAMPTGPDVYAKDLNDVLKKKHELGTYKTLVFYVEACESGSIFEGLLPEDLNIYATTASNSVENSWGTYCPGEYPSSPPEYDTCLGDLYSIAWLEDSDTHNLQTETLKEQYELVRRRTGFENLNDGSHVTQFGDINLSKDNLFLYMGTNPANDNYTFALENSFPSSVGTVNQRDADLIHFWHKFRNAPEGSSRKFKAEKQFLEIIEHRTHIDQSIERIGQLLFGSDKGEKVLKAVRPKGQPLVDDWECLKTMVRTYETHCGSLSQYGIKHMRGMANICNAGIQKEKMAEASAQACVRIPPGPWSSLHKGFSA